MCCADYGPDYLTYHGNDALKSSITTIERMLHIQFALAALAMALVLMTLGTLQRLFARARRLLEQGQLSDHGRLQLEEDHLEVRNE